jgi:hypothetical protein
MSQTALYWLQNFEISELMNALKSAILAWPELHDSLSQNENKIILNTLSQLDLQKLNSREDISQNIHHPAFKELIWISCVAAELELRGLSHIRIEK